jgi:hypothetical protein
VRVAVVLAPRLRGADKFISSISKMVADTGKPIYIRKVFLVPHVTSSSREVTTKRTEQIDVFTLKLAAAVFAETDKFQRSSWLMPDSRKWDHVSWRQLFIYCKYNPVYENSGGKFLLRKSGRCKRIPSVY